MDKKTSKWLGFLRIDLLNPQIDGLMLLSGDKIFMLQLKQEYVIEKVEKAFEFKSTSKFRVLFLLNITFANSFGNWYG